MAGRGCVLRKKVGGKKRACVRGRGSVMRDGEGGARRALLVFAREGRRGR